MADPKTGKTAKKKPSTLSRSELDLRLVQKKTGKKKKGGHVSWLGKRDSHGRPIVRLKSGRILDARLVLFEAIEGSKVNAVHATCEYVGCVAVEHVEPHRRIRAGEETLAECKVRIAAGDSISAVSREMEVSRPTLYSLARGERHAHLLPKGNVLKAKCVPLGEDKAKLARKLLGTMAITEIAKRLDCSYAAAWMAAKGRTWRGGKPGAKAAS